MNTKTNAKDKAEGEVKDPAGTPEAEKQLPVEQMTGTALAVVDIDEEDRGAGLKNIENDERKIPFVRLLQTNSPECDETDGKYVPGAKAGLFMNTSTRQLYPKLVLIACARDHKFIEYTPRAIGGGFVAIHQPKDDLIVALRAQFGKFGKLPRGVTRRDEQGQALDGTEIVESFELYSILIDPETNAKFRAIVPFQSTQIGKYQTFIDRSDSFEYQIAGGEVVHPAIYSHKWLMTSTTEKKKKGTIKGYVLGLLAKKPDGSDDVSIKSFIKKSDPLFIMAKEFGRFVEAGKAEVDYGAAAPEDAKEEVEHEM